MINRSIYRISLSKIHNVLLYEVSSVSIEAKGNKIQHNWEAEIEKTEITCQFHHYGDSDHRHRRIFIKQSCSVCNLQREKIGDDDYHFNKDRFLNYRDLLHECPGKPLSLTEWKFKLRAEFKALEKTDFHLDEQMLHLQNQLKNLEHKKNAINQEKKAIVCETSMGIILTDKRRVETFFC